MIANGVQGWKSVGNLGNVLLTRSNCLVDAEAQIALTSDDAITYVRNYTEATAEFALRNADGGMAVDLPSVRIGSGKLELPRDELVLINTPMAAEYNTTFGYSVSFSHFPYIPQT